MTGDTSGTRGERPALPPASAGLTIAAAVLPFVVASTWMALLVFSVRGVTRLVRNGGTPAWLVLGAFVLGVLALMVLCAVAARGVRLPAVAAIGVAALPWAVGLAGMRLGVHRTIHAVASADPQYYQLMTAAGVGEASACRALGAWGTTALALGAALGLACAAAAPRAANRRGLLAGLGLLVGAPFVAIAHALPVTARAQGALAHDVLVSAILAAVAMAGAFGAAGGDAPNGQSAASSAAAVAASVLAALAAVVGVSGIDAAEALRVLSQVDAASRVLLAAGAGHALVAAEHAQAWMLAAGIVALVAVAAWAVSRARPTLGRLGGAALVLAVLALVVSADRAVMSATVREATLSAAPPWAAIAGFVPIAVGRAGADTDIEVGVVVGPHAVVARGGAPSPFGHAALVAAFRRAAVPPPPNGVLPPDRPGGDGDLPGPSPRSPLDATAAPTVAIALDRRLAAPALREVVRAAGDAGVRSLVLVGRRGTRDTIDRADAQLADAGPLVPPLTLAVAGVRVALESALPPGFADADPALHHLTASVRPVQRFVPRVESASPPFDVALDWGQPNDGDVGRVVYVAIGDDATPDAIAAIAGGAAGQYDGPQVVLLAGAVPGHPERPPPPVPVSPLLAALATGMGSLHVAGTPAPLQQLAGPPREAIQHVMRSHIGTVQRCYETALRRDPSLAGRVIVQFLITPSGGVISASVASSDLPSSVGDCIVAQLRTWQFPPTSGPGEVSVSYPFVFSSAP